MKKEEYGEVMKFLLYFREQHQTDEEYRRFLLGLMRDLVHDLREFNVFISLQPEFLHKPRVIPSTAGPNLNSL